MTPSRLTNLAPMDGRYRDQNHELRSIFSEFALMRYRVLIEIRWLQQLSEQMQITEVPQFSEATNRYLDSLYDNFDEVEAEKIKTLESTTNHDVKAVEYYLKEKTADAEELKQVVEFWHFACTSEDINNLSYALMLQAGNTHLQKLLRALIERMHKLATANASLPMLSRTHGQTASPTTLGKEIANVIYRLQRQLKHLEKQEFLGKMNGAVGNYNTHIIAYPEVDWPVLSKQFIERLGLLQNPLTTQIEPHDFCAELSHHWIRINTILIDFSRDIWSYISLDYFKQERKDGEVSSSTMPHKVNPIDFENAEGNLGLAQAILSHMAEKLPVSRWQRDLTDSTVQRNWGVAFSYVTIALSSLNKGIDKLEVNQQAIRQDLEQNPEVLAEAIQTVMRRYGIVGAYEKLKALTRGQAVSQQEFQHFIAELDIPQQVKQELMQLTVQRYTGLASRLVAHIN